MTSPVGSLSSLSCRCKAGFFAPNNEYCTACSVGKYKDYEGSGYCSSCLDGETTLDIGNASDSNCLCMTGYFPANNVCQPCPAEYYQETLASIGLESCKPCPLYSNSSSGSQSRDSCSCLKGYEGGSSGSYCSICPEGKFKGSVGMDACQGCPEDTFNAVTESKEISDCKCEPGNYNYSLTSQCLPCNLGSYKPLLASSACTPCPPLSNTTDTKRADLSECLCNAGYTWGAVSYCEDVDECTSMAPPCVLYADCHNTVGAYYCTCKPGWEFEGSLCVDVNECQRLTAFCDYGVSTCENMFGSFNCPCVAGYEKSGEACVNTNGCLNASYVCQNHTDCFDTIGSFYCQCKAGYRESAK
ncbi:hypothetical protein GUITHDRAFT_72381 [Guillardia theta CCMP2712]|uniref:EGF-like domain-containing protein n=1 Tax=Guillardia theta (strain CCMP2712) TaxID=905079 RepID=L1J888_GUITC|nr:hypothetical protein GUITHDRAFT_72381 [Guillardia theta CCMP2712]EKX44299.1 hypothetical protein GUITHDRAFT_72381 [Guillardia theta CCMP2712]|eukprot:XP_005831279.1 hypothetical protein GUITHDRAFT_72381 [Guillardia theta CCMP2712]